MLTCRFALRPPSQRHDCSLQALLALLRSLIHRSTPKHFHRRHTRDAHESLVFTMTRYISVPDDQFHVLPLPPPACLRLPETVFMIGPFDCRLLSLKFPRYQRDQHMIKQRCKHDNSADFVPCADANLQNPSETYPQQEQDQD